MGNNNKRNWIELIIYFFQFKKRHIETIKKERKALAMMDLEDLEAQKAILNRKNIISYSVFGVATTAFASIIVGSFGNNVLKWIAGFNHKAVKEAVKKAAPTKEQITQSIQIMELLVFFAILFYIVLLIIFIRAIATNKVRLEMYSDIIKQKRESQKHE